MKNRVWQRVGGISGFLWALAPLSGHGGGLVQIQPIPEAVAQQHKLDLGFYQKWINAGGIPVISSGKVDDVALAEVRYLILGVLAGRDELREAMAKEGVWVGVMAHDEFTTDMPEMRDMSPWWNKRARGLGGNPVTCGEENILNLKGDPYKGENIFIHEFAHSIHLIGLKAVDPAFDKKLKALYERTKEGGRFSGYCMQDAGEFWAEGVQTWFDCNRDNIIFTGEDGSSIPIRTREQLQNHMPELAALLKGSLGDNPWRYTTTEMRPTDAHLAGFDREKAPVFSWPERVIAASNEEEARRKGKK